MSGVVLTQSAVAATTVAATTRRALWFESLDGSKRVGLNGPSVILQGVKGLGAPPLSVAMSITPGVPGAHVDEVRAQPRPVTLPIGLLAASRTDLDAMVDALRAVLAPDGPGGCYLVCQDESKVRHLQLQYRSGLDGENHGWRSTETFVLDLVAVRPYAVDRAERVVQFRVQSAAGGIAMVTDDPVAAAAVGVVRGLGSSTVLGEAWPVMVVSEVPVWPRLTVVGPLTGSVHIESPSGLDVTIPGGVAAGSTLVIDTDPRARSIRYDGALAAGRIALGSTFAPLTPGAQTLTVEAIGATAASMVSVAWRGAWWSLL